MLYTETVFEIQKWISPTRLHLAHFFRRLISRTHNSQHFGRWPTYYDYSPPAVHLFLTTFSFSPVTNCLHGVSSPYICRKIKLERIKGSLSAKLK